MAHFGGRKSKLFRFCIGKKWQLNGFEGGLFEVSPFKAESRFLPVELKKIEIDLYTLRRVMGNGQL